MSPVNSDSPASPTSKNLIEFTSNPQLAPRACDSCRKRKIKCDRKSNFCNQCFKNGTRCTYQDPIRKRGRPTKAKLSMKSLLLSTAQSSDCSESANPLPTPTTTTSTFIWDRDELPPINSFLQIHCVSPLSRYDDMPAYDLSKYSTCYQSLPDNNKDPIDFYKQFATTTTTKSSVKSNYRSIL